MLHRSFTGNTVNNPEFYNDILAGDDECMAGEDASGFQVIDVTLNDQHDGTAGISMVTVVCV